jgi:hypothetical protein
MRLKEVRCQDHKVTIVHRLAPDRAVADTLRFEQTDEPLDQICALVAMAGTAIILSGRQTTPAARSPACRPSSYRPASMRTGLAGFSIELLGRPFSEATLIRLAHGYEQASRKRVETVVEPAPERRRLHLLTPCVTARAGHRRTRSCTEYRPPPHSHGGNSSNEPCGGYRFSRKSSVGRHSQEEPLNSDEFRTEGGAAPRPRRRGPRVPAGPVTSVTTSHSAGCRGDRGTHQAASETVTGHPRWFEKPVTFPALLPLARLSDTDLAARAWSPASVSTATGQCDPSMGSGLLRGPAEAGCPPAGCEHARIPRSAVIKKRSR